MGSQTPRWWPDRNAALFVGISLLSGFGSALMMLTAGIWVLSLTGSSSLAALAGFCVFLPTLAGPVLGALVDRLPRRPLMIWISVGTAGTLLCLLAVRSAAQSWLIYAVMLAYGVSFVLLDAGEAALLPAALPADTLGRINGLRMSAQEGMKLLAPLVGAALFSWRGGHPVSVVAAFTLACGGGLYALVKVPTGRAASPIRRDGHGSRRPGVRRTGDRIRDGIRFIWTDRPVRATTAVGAVTIAMSGLTTASVYAVVTGDLHRPAAFVGVLASTQGAGAILGGLVVGRLLTRQGETMVGAVGATLFALGSAGRCVPWWPAVAASSFVIGVGLPWTLVAALTAVQRRTPEQLLGRVAATANTLLFGPIAVATPAGALLILPDHRLPLAVATVACLAAGTVLLVRYRRAERPEAGPSGPDAVSAAGQRTGEAATGQPVRHATAGTHRASDATTDRAVSGRPAPPAPARP